MDAKVFSGFLIALASAAPAFAQDYISIEELADRTGLTERQVRMVLGPSSAYPEYRTSFDLATARVADALYHYELRPAVEVGNIETAPARTTTTARTSAVTVPAPDTTSDAPAQLKFESSPSEPVLDDDYYDDD